MTELDDVDATAGIVDGRIAMTADGPASVYVDGRDRRPLSREEAHATVRLEGDDFRAAVELDAADLAALTDALDIVKEAWVDD